MGLYNIVVVGGIASGKTAFCRYAVRHYGGLTFSSDELFGRKEERAQITKVFANVIAERGPGYITDRMIEAYDERVAKGYDGPRILYHGGLRHMAGLRHIREHPRFLGHHLVWLKVDDGTRYEHYRYADFYRGDRNLSFEGFMELNESSFEQELPLLREEAHSVIENVGTLADFNDAIDDVMEKLGVPRLD